MRTLIKFLKKIKPSVFILLFVVLALISIFKGDWTTALIDVFFMQSIALIDSVEQMERAVRALINLSEMRDLITQMKEYAHEGEEDEQNVSTGSVSSGS